MSELLHRSRWCGCGVGVADRISRRPLAGHTDWEARIRKALALHHPPQRRDPSEREKETPIFALYPFQKEKKHPRSRYDAKDGEYSTVMHVLQISVRSGGSYVVRDLECAGNNRIGAMPSGGDPEAAESGQVGQVAPKRVRGGRCGAVRVHYISSRGVCTDTVHSRRMHRY